MPGLKVIVDLLQQEQRVPAALVLDDDEQETPRPDLVIERTREVMGTRGEGDAIVRTAVRVSIAPVRRDHLNIADAQFNDDSGSPLRHLRNDLETADRPGRSDDVADQRGVPSRAGSKLQY